VLYWPTAGFTKLCAAAHHCAANVFDNLHIMAYLLIFRNVLRDFLKVARLVGWLRPLVFEELRWTDKDAIMT